jgi:hypothetical protein
MSGSQTDSGRWRKGNILQLSVVNSNHQVSNNDDSVSTF